MLFCVTKFVLVFVDAVGKPEIYYTFKLSLADKSNVRLFVSWFTFFKAVWLSILPSSLDLVPVQMHIIEPSGSGWQDQTCSSP